MLLSTTWTTGNYAVRLIAWVWITPSSSLANCNTSLMHTGSCILARNIFRGLEQHHQAGSTIKQTQQLICGLQQSVQADRFKAYRYMGVKHNIITLGRPQGMPNKLIKSTAWRIQAARLSSSQACSGCGSCRYPLEKPNNLDMVRNVTCSKQNHVVMGICPHPGLTTYRLKKKPHEGLVHVRRHRQASRTEKSSS